MNMKAIIKDAVILCLITLVAGVALGLTNEVTKPLIAAVRTEKANATYREVYPEAESFRDSEELTKKALASAETVGNLGYGKVTVDDCLEAVDGAGNVIGHLVTATSNEGYGGAVQISVGITNDGKVTGLGFLTINETPGLGMKAKDAAFRDQFPGKNGTLPLTLKKTGTAGESDVQAISGATFTSNAVTGALNAAVYFVNNCL